MLRAKPLQLRYSQRLEASLRSDLACRSQASMPRRGAPFLMGVRYTSGIGIQELGRVSGSRTKGREPRGEYPRLW